MHRRGHHQRVADQKPRREHHRAQAGGATIFQVIGHQAVGRNQQSPRDSRGCGTDAAAALPGAISIGIGLVVLVT